MKLSLVSKSTTHQSFWYHAENQEEAECLWQIFKNMTIFLNGKRVRFGKKGQGIDLEGTTGKFKGNETLDKLLISFIGTDLWKRNPRQR